MKRITFLLLMTWSVNAISQEKLEIDGNVKIGTMLPSDSDSIVVWNNDGTLRIREASTLTEKQILSISNDTIFLTNGEFVKLPAEVDGDVTNEKISSLTISGDSLEIIEGGITMKVAVDSSNTNELQILSISNDTIYLSQGQYAKLPADDNAGWVMNGDTTSTIKYLGIGTTSPIVLGSDRVLEMMSDDEHAGSIMQLSNKNRSHYLRLFSGKSGEGPFIWWNQGEDLRFVTDEGDYSPKMIIRSNGDLDMKAHKIKDIADPMDAQDAATKAYIDEIVTGVMNTFAKSNETFTSPISGTVTDIDGNTYDIIKIGSQWWMAENLRTTKYRDGSAITYAQSNLEWGDLTAGQYCFHDTTGTGYSTYSQETFGALYNWHAVDDIRGLCPSGWHVPSEDIIGDDSEWQILVNFLGGDATAGTKMQTTSGWYDPGDFTNGGDNTSGFSGLPGGVRTASFQSVGYLGSWWSSQIDRVDLGGYVVALCRQLLQGGIVLPRSDLGEYGMSVRCLRD